jgi:hypothetical protein
MCTVLHCVTSQGTVMFSVATVRIPSFRTRTSIAELCECCEDMKHHINGIIKMNIQGIGWEGVD